MPQQKQKPKIQVLPFKRPQQHKNSWTNPPEKVTAISLKIKRNRQKDYYLKDIPIQKIIALDQHHRTNHNPTTWKLSEDKTTLLLT